MSRPLPPPDIHFWSKVQKSDGCWLWLGGLQGGHPTFVYRKRSHRATRYAWRLTFGAAPSDSKVCILHTCGNRRCVRPGHLQLGGANDLRATDPRERFWRKVVKTDDGCWIWTAARSPRGYGAFGRGSREARVILAHRFSWEQANGPIPDGLCVLHRCDNPPCVNPAHLFLGTRTDNNRDMHAKGRANPPRGERHPRARLTEEKVREIRRLAAAGISQRQIARMFGVSKGAVASVVTRQWKHVA